MPLQTIDAVIQALTVIVEDCERTQNRSGYFAALYKRMTMAVKSGIDNGAFMDGNRMEKLDVTFAARYLDAYEAYRKGEACSTSWKYALDGCTNESLTVIQQLILGINTHINLDLAIASAVVAPGDSIHDLQTDFNRINEVIASLFDDVQESLEEVWPPMRLLRRVGQTQQTDVLNFSIGAARKTAWVNAVILAGANDAGQHAYIQEMDAMVYRIAQRVIRPGVLSETLLRVIRETEYDDTARTIRLIDTTVVG